MTVAGTREGEGAFDPESWFPLVHRLAEACAARCNIEDYANDLAQEAFAVQWERLRAEGREFRADEAERLVRGLAEAERHARDVERRHHVTRPEPLGPAPPELCPKVARLAPAHARPGAFRTRLRAAAHCVARLPGILRDGQLRIFDLVWIAGSPPGTAAALLGISARAAHERLGRASDRLEKRILRDLRATMTASRWEQMHLFLAESDGVPPSRAVADAVFAGLGQVIHTHTLSLGIE